MTSTIRILLRSGDVPPAEGSGGRYDFKLPATYHNVAELELEDLCVSREPNIRHGDNVLYMTEFGLTSAPSSPTIATYRIVIPIGEYTESSLATAITAAIPSALPIPTTSTVPAHPFADGTVWVKRTSNPAGTYVCAYSSAQRRFVITETTETYGISIHAESRRPFDTPASLSYYGGTLVVINLPDYDPLALGAVIVMRVTDAVQNQVDLSFLAVNFLNRNRTQVVYDTATGAWNAAWNSHVTITPLRVNLRLEQDEDNVAPLLGFTPSAQSTIVTAEAPTVWSACAVSVAIAGIDLEATTSVRTVTPHGLSTGATVIITYGTFTYTGAATVVSDTVFTVATDSTSYTGGSSLTGTVTTKGCVVARKVAGLRSADPRCFIRLCIEGALYERTISASSTLGLLSWTYVPVVTANFSGDEYRKSGGLGPCKMNSQSISNVSVRVSTGDDDTLPMDASWSVVLRLQSHGVPQGMQREPCVDDPCQRPSKYPALMDRWM